MGAKRRGVSAGGKEGRGARGGLGARRVLRQMAELGSPGGRAGGTGCRRVFRRSNSLPVFGGSCRRPRAEANVRQLPTTDTKPRAGRCLCSCLIRPLLLQTGKPREAPPIGYWAGPGSQVACRSFSGPCSVYKNTARLCRPETLASR